MKPGRAFYIHDMGYNGHFWFIISCPDINKDKIVIVNVTNYESWKGNDCELFEGDHPYISKKSVIFYADAQVVTKSMLLKWEEDGILVIHDDFASDELLGKIRNGAATTRHLPFFAKSILIEQGLI